MPIRIPRPGRTEVLSFGIAGVGAFAPLYMILPGAEERLAHQTTKWAPRWERNLSYFTPTAQRSIQRVAPSVERTVKRVDQRLPLERMTKKVDGNIKKGINRISPSSSA